MNSTFKALAPVLVALGLALLLTPENLAPPAWYFFAIFAGVIAGLILEPLPGGTVGLIGVTLIVPRRLRTGCAGDAVLISAPSDAIEAGEARLLAGG